MAKAWNRSYENGGRLRSHRITLRRSPRFLSQEKDEPTSTKNPNSSKKPLSEKSHLKSSPISPNPEKKPFSNKPNQYHFTKTQKNSSKSVGTMQEPSILVDASLSRRKSARLVSNSSEPSTERVLTSGKKIQQGYFPETCKKPSRSSRLIETQKSTPQECQRKHMKPTGIVFEGPRSLRRSQRLATNFAEATKIGIVLDATTKLSEASERRQLNVSKSDVKVHAKAKVGISCMNYERGIRDNMKVRRKNDDHPSKRTPNSGARKRRKMEGIGEGNFRMERIEEEVHGGLSGRTIEHKNGSEKRASTGRAKIEKCHGFLGWTEDEEMALRSAYFVARPSPHFWKKVSKMVPGKTPQECFDRVHADFVTPPRPRSRKTTSNLSPIGHFNLSANKSTEFTKLKIKRLRSSKKKSLVALKTARHLLRKHCLIDQSHEVDHFSVLENSSSALALDFPDIGTPEMPDFKSRSPSLLQKCNMRPSTDPNKILMLRPALSPQFNYTSPPILKQVKNIALHEKYIDILHCREAKRRTFSKASLTATDHTSNSELKTGVKAARTALVSEARDVISRFEHMQVNTLSNHDDDNTDDDDDDDDDDDSDDDVE